MGEHEETYRNMQRMIRIHTQNQKHGVQENAQHFHDNDEQEIKLVSKKLEIRQLQFDIDYQDKLERDEDFLMYSYM